MSGDMFYFSPSYIGNKEREIIEIFSKKFKDNSNPRNVKLISVDKLMAYKLKTTPI